MRLKRGTARLLTAPTGWKPFVSLKPLTSRHAPASGSTSEMNFNHSTDALCPLSFFKGEGRVRVQHCGCVQFLTPHLPPPRGYGATSIPLPFTKGRGEHRLPL